MRLSGRKPSSFTRHWTPRQKFALVALLTANIAVFLIQFLLQSYDPNLVRNYLGLSDRGIDSAYAWQFFTAAFLHAGPWDLLINTLVLFLLGRDLESILGQRQFLLLYFSGIFGGQLGHLFLMPMDSILFAASGGTAAILVAYAIILPEFDLNSAFSATLPVRLKAKYLVYVTFGIGLLLVVMDRGHTVVHSAYLGGAAAGWVVAHLLGFGRPSLLQRMLHQREVEAERIRRMSPDQFMSEEIDPLLDKIAKSGITSLSRAERRKLAQAREKIAEESESQ